MLILFDSRGQYRTKWQRSKIAVKKDRILKIGIILHFKIKRKVTDADPKWTTIASAPRGNRAQVEPHMRLVSVSDIRETAFVYAITAAGVSHAVTQACSMGDLLQCGCEATRNRAPPKPLSSSSSSSVDGAKWEWGGCGDDVEFGYEKSKQFMDAKRRRGKSDIRTLVDLHNNEAGRLVTFFFFKCLHTQTRANGVQYEGFCHKFSAFKKN